MSWRNCEACGHERDPIRRPLNVQVPQKVVNDLMGEARALGVPIVALVTAKLRQPIAASEICGECIAHTRGKQRRAGMGE